jgi:undecaprenyl-diphosphatase
MFKFILLGIVQGITEFLPVSSSGHLVVLQHILEIKENIVFLDVVLHLGTLCSLLVFFGKDISVLCFNFFTAVNDILFRRGLSYILRYDDKFKLSLHIIVITIITGSVAVAGKDFFEQQFENINTVILSWFLMSIILFLTRNFNDGQRRLRHISFADSLLFGLIQSFAIIPGISRSGITISFLLFRNLERDDAYKLSFLVSIPIILGAFVVKFKEVQGTTIGIPLFYLVSGFLFAFLSGLVALYVLRLILKQSNFYRFSYYCFFIAALILILKLRGIL